MHKIHWIGLGKQHRTDNEGNDRFGYHLLPRAVSLRLGNFRPEEIHVLAARLATYISSESTAAERNKIGSSMGWSQGY